VGQTHANLSGEHVQLYPIYDIALIMFVNYITVKSK